MSQVNIMSQEKKMSDKLGQDCIFLLLESKRPGEETEFIHIIIKHKKKKSPVNSLAAQETSHRSNPCQIGKLLSMGTFRGIGEFIGYLVLYHDLIRSTDKRALLEAGGDGQR